MLAFIALAVAVSGPAPCSGDTTPEVNACLGARFEESDATLNRYFQAALGRIQKESGGSTAKQFMKSEQLWGAYRDAECSSVVNYWSGGTIRVSMELDCPIRLIALRTFAIWRDWLTYPDSTPPLLPRPNVESVTSVRSGG